MAEVEYRDRVEERETLMEEPPAPQFDHPMNLRWLASNTTSQIAIVGSNLCPIESLDYEMVENDFFKQDWRNRGRAHILRYVFLKWIFCFFVGISIGCVGFFNNLAVEIVAGFKFVQTSNLMLKEKLLPMLLLCHHLFMWVSRPYGARRYMHCSLSWTGWLKLIWIGM